MGCGCGSKTSPGTYRANQAPSGPMVAVEEANVNMQDDDMVMVRYTHPNRGQHPVIGPATGINYHYHAGGDRFLVHREDIALMPQHFQPVDEARTRERIRRQQQSAPAPPAPPPPPENGGVEPDERVAEPTGDDPDNGQEDVAAQRVAQTDELLDLLGPLNLDRRAIASLYQAGVTSADDVVELGKEGLRELKWIGETRAEEIYNLARES